MSSLMSRLRLETHDLHQHVEGRLPVMDPDLTLERYRGLLAQLLSLYAPLEAAHAALPIPEAFSLPARRKAPLLEADLNHLGADTRLESPAGAAPHPALALPENVAAALGTLYVLEGSTLGGQLIARQLRRVLKVGPESGGRFFHGYGAQTGPMWRAFGQALEAAAPPETHAQVVAGARLGFSLFGAVLA